MTFEEIYEEIDYLCSDIRRLESDVNAIFEAHNASKRALDEKEKELKILRDKMKCPDDCVYNGNLGEAPGAIQCVYCSRNPKMKDYYRKYEDIEKRVRT